MIVDDKVLLQLLKAHSFTGIKYNNKWFPKEPGESPAAFVSRIREEINNNNEWETSEKDKIRSRENNSQESNKREKISVSNSTNIQASQSLQGSQKSLEEVLEAQISSLRRLVESKEAEITETSRRIKQLEEQKFQADKQRHSAFNEIRLIEKWLDEIAKEQPPSKGGREISNHISRKTKKK